MITNKDAELLFDWLVRRYGHSWSLAPDYRAANTTLIGILLLSVATPVISDTCLAQRRGSIRGQGDVS